MAFLKVTFHPEKDLTLLDVTADAILVVHGSLTQSQSLRFGSLHGVDYTSPTTSRPRFAIWIFVKASCGQSYKHFTSINYDSGVVRWAIFNSVRL